MVLGVEQAVLSNQLDDFHAELEEDQAPKKIFQLPVFKYLAAACIGLLVISIGWMLSSDSTGNQWVMEAFEPDPGLPTLMGVRPSEGNTYKYDFDKAMVSYKVGKYDDAINAWNTLLKDKPQSDTLNYFLGVSHLAIGAAENAEPHFKVVIKQDDSVFKSDAHWYYGLTLIQLGRLNAAKETLQQSQHDGKTLILDRLNE
ncbi:MAG: tetratricopeptide repeat protein [Bacteroidota bacterium]